MKHASSSPTLAWWVAAAFLVALLGACFHEGLAGTGAIDAAARLPFEDGLYAYPQGVKPPQFFIDTSPEVMHQPADHLAGQQLRAGHMPLWNPHSALGVPLMANGQTTPFNPLKAIMWLGGAAVGPLAAWFLVSRLIVLAIGTLLLARRLGLSVEGAALAAAAATLNGFMAYHFNFPEIHTMAMLPWLVWAADRLVERPSLRRTAAFGLAIGLTGYLGHPEAALFAAGSAVMVGLAGALASPTGRGARLGALAAACGLGAALAALAVLPFLAFVRTSDSYLLSRHGRPGEVGITLFGLLRLTARHLFFVEEGPTALYFNAWIGTVALGLAPFGLAPFGLAAPGVGRVVWPLLATVALAFLVLPPGNVVALLPVAPNAIYVVPVLAFALALAGGAGLDRVLAWPRGRHLALGGALAVALGVLAAHLLRPALFDPLPRGWSGAVFGGLLALALALAPRLGRRAAAALLVGLAGVELALGMRLAVPVLPPFSPGRPPAVAFLDGLPGPFRVAGANAFMRPNTNLFFGLDAIELLDAFVDRRTIAFLAAMNGAPSPDGIVFTVAPTFRPALLDLANVRYLFVADGPGGDAMRRALAAKPGGSRAVFHHDQLSLYENAGALPRARVMYAADFVPPGTPEAAIRLAADPERWRTRALIEAPAPAGWQDGAAAPTAATPIPGGYEAQLDRPGWLVVSEAYAPAWHAQVDGRPAEVFPADVAFRAVPLGAGRHRVTFRYEPPEVGRALAISLAALLLALAGLAWRGRRTTESTSA